MSKAKLIVLEGADSAGKSTQLEFIKSYLTEAGYKFDFLHFPKYGHNEFSNIIAAYLRGEYGDIDKVNPYFVADIYAMDRYLFLPELKKMMQENDVVLLDRYVFSNIAYQCSKYPTGSKEATQMKQWIYDKEFNFLGLPYPNLTIYFDYPLNIIWDRLKSKREGSDRDYLNGKDDIHEKDATLQMRVRENYLALSDMLDYKIIPCSKDNDTSLTPQEIYNNTEFLYLIYSRTTSTKEIGE
jgi:dTMP kinase